MKEPKYASIERQFPFGTEVHVPAVAEKVTRPDEKRGEIRTIGSHKLAKALSGKVCGVQTLLEGYISGGWDEPTEFVPTRSVYVLLVAVGYNRYVTALPSDVSEVTTDA